MPDSRLVSNRQGVHLNSFSFIFIRASGHGFVGSGDEEWVGQGWTRCFVSEVREAVMVFSGRVASQPELIHRRVALRIGDGGWYVACAKGAVDPGIAKLAISTC